MGFLLISCYAKKAYYAVYETTLIGSAKKDSISSYVADANILGTIISLIAPALMGFLITDYSYYIAIGFVLIDAIISMFIATRTNFVVITSDFHLLKYWRKAIKNSTMRKAYVATFLKRLSGPDGVLEYLIPILLFLALGNLIGILIAFIVYNYFYSKDVFAVIIVIFMAFFVLNAYFFAKT